MEHLAGRPFSGRHVLERRPAPELCLRWRETTLGGVNEPNVAVYPGTGTVPYPSGVAGTPGRSTAIAAASARTPRRLACVAASRHLAPVLAVLLPGRRAQRRRLADRLLRLPAQGRRRGDHRRALDRGGRSWTNEGKALEQNPGYCPTADTNDDGQGHPYVAPIGASTKLYTLNRPAGDYEGVGLLVHNVEQSAADPLASLPSAEAVGIDPNTYAEAEVEVPTSGGVSIPVSTLGSEGSPEHIVAGPYEDYNAASPSQSVLTCAGTSTEPLALTGCTVAGATPLLVKSKDDLVQVIATANPEEVTSKEPKKGATYTIPAGPTNRRVKADWKSSAS